MHEPLEKLIKEAFPAEGEISAERLRLARRIQAGSAKNRVALRRLQWCVGLLLITAGAMSAGMHLERTFLSENGKVVGTATDMGNGTYLLNLSRLPTEGRPLNLEVRDDKGRIIGFQTIGVTTRGDQEPAAPTTGATKVSKPIPHGDRSEAESARSPKSDAIQEVKR